MRTLLPLLIFAFPTTVFSLDREEILHLREQPHNMEGISKPLRMLSLGTEYEVFTTFTKEGDPTVEDSCRRTEKFVDGKYLVTITEENTFSDSGLVRYEWIYVTEFDESQKIYRRWITATAKHGETVTEVVGMAAGDFPAVTWLDIEVGRAIGANLLILDRIEPEAVIRRVLTMKEGKIAAESKKVALVTKKH